MVVATVVAFFETSWLLGIVVAIVAAIMIELTRYVVRDLRGKWGLSVVFGANRIDLVLPAHRSLIHATPWQRLSIPYSDIAAVETRLESYTSLGMANMQRPYVLRLRNGDRVFLFEERAIGTGLESSYFGGVIEEIARRANVPVDDLGMTKGGGGVLGVRGTHAADWASPALSKSEQNRLWGRAVGTGRIAFLVIMAAFAIRALFGLFG